MVLLVSYSQYVLQTQPSVSCICLLGMYNVALSLLLVALVLLLLFLAILLLFDNGIGAIESVSLPGPWLSNGCRGD